MPFRRLDLRTAVLLVSATYILHLGAAGRLGFYIHPRYIVFTIVLSALGLIVTAIGVSKADENHTSHGSRLSLLPLGIIVSAALIAPVRSLSSATVSQRSIDSGSIVSPSNYINPLFSGSSRGLSLADWYRLLAANDSPGFFANKPANVSGFVYDVGLGPDTVWLARFVVTCCAVDAQPIGVPVHIEGWQDSYDQDQWLEVEGEFDTKTTADGPAVVLVPGSVKRIEEPRNPYAN